MEKYLDIIHRNIHLFISNYLIEGRVKDVKGSDDINSFITDLFPFLGTLYLLKENCSVAEVEEFKKKNLTILDEETKKLAKVLGHFLMTFDAAAKEKTKEISDLGSIIYDFEIKLEDIRKKYSRLNDDYKKLQKKFEENKKEYLKLKSKFEFIAEQNETLQKKLEDKEKVIRELKNPCDKSLKTDSNNESIPLTEGMKAFAWAFNYVIEKQKEEQEQINSTKAQDILKRKNLYREASHVSYDNVFEIIKECLPFNKNYFNDDIVDLKDLDIEKLNLILKLVYDTGPLSPASIEGLKYKQLKYKIVNLIKNSIR